MKKFLLAAALAMASTSAMADRTVSASSSALVDYNSKAQACDGAKREAASHRRDNEQVDSYSKCECDKNDRGFWSCSVDAKLEKKE